MVSNADKVKKAVNMKIWQILVIGYDEPSNPDAVVMSDSDTTFMLWYFRNKFYKAIDLYVKNGTKAEKDILFMQWYQDQPPQVPLFSLLDQKSIM
jgi:Gpi18-like mannosyltransferase